ncbi:MAG TPA: MBL fold metallo-hydrolase [Thermoanaerobaculia bacterium]|jgi:L-ascorbate metabolism protein UlaG (beta-lactamase superfamily)
MARIELAATTPVDASTLGDGSVFFIGTATVLIRFGGYTILTDPNFLHQGDHVHLGYGLVSTRLTEPALDVDELPPVDLVVLSHYHGDHWDRIAEAKLDRNLPIVTTKHAATRLRATGFNNTYSLEEWESVTAHKPGALPLRITAMPGKHGPTGVNFVLPPVMGSLLEFGDSANPFRLFITGDTLIHEEFRHIPKRVKGIHLALLHLGGTRVLGVLVTMDAEQGVEAFRILDPQTAIPIHYNDYEVFKSPLDDFKRAIREAGHEDRVRYLAHGETFRWRFDGRYEPV